ncbi:MAG TPA: tryptophan synthase subunit alpha [Anaerolineales bacterium]|nr:tryptophan synthase subunit alpha [Anaerolineales bacterium]
MNGLDRIAAVFSKTKNEGRAALMPYFTLGFPNKQASLEVVESLAAAGADLIELGVPFSDPLADGPTIQHSTQVALENGANLSDCLKMVKDLRGRGIKQPLLLMGYYNPILAFGPEYFVSEACTAGADGLIVPDLPLEEAAIIETACRKHRLALVYLVAPTTPDERLALVASHSTGFVYIVSLTGVTGARQTVAAGLDDFIRRVRAATDKPVAVGFGISTPEQASRIGKLSDGVIVGSALVDAAEKAEDPSSAAGDFLHRLRLGLEKQPEQM